MHRSISYVLFAFVLARLAVADPIDRPSVVHRHDVRVQAIDPEAALCVGNGDFAFTVDVTGLQSFGDLYFEKGLPLETLSTWAWHSFPNPHGYTLADATKPSDFHGRPVPYASLQASPAGKYFRENPHPIPLGQISLQYRGQAVDPKAVTAIDQHLDLWTGLITSRYLLDGQPVTVETVADGRASIIAVRLRSPLVKAGALQVRFHFPYTYKFSSDAEGARNKPPFVWAPESHRTVISRQTPGFAQLERTLDEAHTFVQVAWRGVGALTETAPHDFQLRAAEGETLEFTAEFSSAGHATAPAGFESVRQSSATMWHDYWTKGGMIDLAGSKDPRAAELERRVVLSLYLMKVHYAGHVPPSETGLAQISWFGKHNSEMYFWHAAQFYQWGHVDSLENGLAWYRSILPVALAAAKEQGFTGARWPKMTGPDGRTGPGSINPFIIWNQPNPIYLCELVYRARPERTTLEKYRDVVFESVNFLASFAYYDEATKRYVLGPPIKPVSERAAENATQNPTFELAYWYYALNVAQTWRSRLGMAPDPKWTDVVRKLSRPAVSEGKYLELETEPEIYHRKGGLPTTMLLALGYLPQTDFIDVETARQTFAAVNGRNSARWVSWQLGQGALTATRLGEPEAAVRILTNPSPQTRFMPSGYVRRPKEPNGCVAYLPVNSSLLAAVGLMAGGWDGGPNGTAPGFPRDGNWNVRVERVLRMP